MDKYYKVEISAETKEQADEILNSLLSKKLVTGGQIINAPAGFLWKGKVTDMNYYTINSFTVERHKDAIMTEVSNISIEEVPMIGFYGLDGNDELLKWITDTVA